MFQRISAITLTLAMLLAALPAKALDATGATRPVVAVPQPTKATYTFEGRYTGKLNYLEVYRTEGRVTFPDVVSIGLPEFGYRSLAVSGGYAVIADDHLYLMPQVGLAVDSAGNRYFQPAIVFGWNDGPWSAGLYANVGLPLNRTAPHKLVVDPVDLEYRFGKVGVGASFTGICINGGWATRLGPMIRYHPDERTFIEVRAARANPGNYTEILLRFNITR